MLHCPYCHGWEVADQRLGVIATSPLSLHQIELVRQWSDRVTAFTADLGAIDADASRRLGARNIATIPAAVVEVRQNPSGALIVSTADGEVHEVDALFVGPEPRLNLEAFDDLTLARTEGPGRPLTADASGATSHPRVWAAGNVVAPYANVPVAMGAGSMAGAGVNAALVAEDTRDAMGDE